MLYRVLSNGNLSRLFTILVYFSTRKNYSAILRKKCLVNAKIALSIENKRHCYKIKGRFCRKK